MRKMEQFCRSFLSNRRPLKQVLCSCIRQTMETDTAGTLEAGVNITGVSISGRENNSRFNETLKVNMSHSDKM